MRLALAALVIGFALAGCTSTKPQKTVCNGVSVPVGATDVKCTNATPAGSASGGPSTSYTTYTVK
jgi:hypothetical protein